MATYYIAGIVKEDDGSGYSVYFPDVPNVCASGTSIPEAVENASEGLYLALRGLAEDRQDAPTPSDMETVKAKVREIREIDELPYPEDTVYQYIKAPAIDMVLEEIRKTEKKENGEIIMQNWQA